MNIIIVIILSILFFHYFFLLGKEYYFPVEEFDCSKCNVEVIEDKKDPNYDGTGVIVNDFQYKPRQLFDKDKVGNVIGRFERFQPNMKQSDQELEKFVQMNSLQRM